MRELVKICDESDLPKEGRVCEMAGGRLCVARVNGEIAVLDNACPHHEGPLGQGMVEDGRVVCPYHAWAFDVKTGAALHNPAAKVRVYESVIKDHELWVRPPDYAAEA
jgi:nitrite reductase (NADH) small subunit